MFVQLESSELLATSLTISIIHCLALFGFDRLTHTRARAHTH